MVDALFDFEGLEGEESSIASTGGGVVENSMSTMESSFVCKAAGAEEGVVVGNNIGSIENTQRGFVSMENSTGVAKISKDGNGVIQNGNFAMGICDKHTGNGKLPNGTINPVGNGNIIHANDTENLGGEQIGDVGSDNEYCESFTTWDTDSQPEYSQNTQITHSTPEDQSQFHKMEMIY